MYTSNPLRVRVNYSDVKSEVSYLVKPFDLFSEDEYIAYAADHSAVCPVTSVRLSSPRESSNAKSAWRRNHRCSDRLNRVVILPVRSHAGTVHPYFETIDRRVIPSSFCRTVEYECQP